MIPYRPHPVLHLLDCTRMPDHLAVHERQPYRSEFVAILSNFESSWLFIARYDHQKNVTIYEQWADSIADAIIFANHISNSQYWTRIPKLDGRFGSQYSILTVSRHHFLLSLSQPKPSLTASLKTVASTHAHNTRSKVKSHLIPGVTLLGILLIPNAVLS